MARAEDLADPALVAPEARHPLGDAVGEAGRGRDLEPVVAQDPDRGRIGPQDALRLVDDHPEEVGPIVRRGQPAGDAEDRVETLGELGLEPRIGDHPGGLTRGLRTHQLVAADHPLEDGAAARRRRSVGRPGGHRGPVRDGVTDSSFWARAHVPMVAVPGRSEGPPSVIERGQDHRRFGD